MRYLLPVIAASLMLVAYSCTRPKNEEEKLGVVSDVQNAPPGEVDTTTLPTGRGPQQQNAPGQVPKPNTDWDKKIIKTGTLTVEINNYHKYNDQIHQLVNKWEAYIASEEENSSDYKIENALTIKIPVQYFDEAVQQLSSSAPGKLLAKQVAAQDVTAEYFDTRARMETKKRIRMRYLDMVQKAKTWKKCCRLKERSTHCRSKLKPVRAGSIILVIRQHIAPST